MTTPTKASEDKTLAGRSPRDLPLSSRALEATAWHTKSVLETASLLTADAVAGLTSSEAAARLAEYGPNALPDAKRRSLFAIVVRQFMSVMVGLLVAAAVVAVALGDVVEASAILVVTVINAAIGAFTEWKAAAALAGLRKDVVHVARVIREGAERQIGAEDVVPGDLVLIGEGDRIPADGRVTDGARLDVDESALTGESLPVAKRSDTVEDAAAALGDRFGMVHMGTAVTGGHGRFVVTSTGARTEMGKVDALVAGAGDRSTPLEAKLAHLGRALVVVVAVVCAVVVLVGWLRGYKLLYMVEVGICSRWRRSPRGSSP